MVGGLPLAQVVAWVLDILGKKLHRTQANKTKS
jgi:hypothetical protein